MQKALKYPLLAHVIVFSGFINGGTVQEQSYLRQIAIYFGYCQQEQAAKPTPNNPLRNVTVQNYLDQLEVDLNGTKGYPIIPAHQISQIKAIIAGDYTQKIYQIVTK